MAAAAAFAVEAAHLEHMATRRFVHDYIRLAIEGRKNEHPFVLANCGIQVMLIESLAFGLSLGHAG